MAVYAVSDIHGQYELFLKGLEKIGFSDDDELYVIGDAIDRGPDGIKLLLHIMEHTNMDLLIGNHEAMMLRSVNPDGQKHCGGDKTILWLYYNGGRVTYEQYGSLSDKKRQELLTWLNERYVIKTVDLDRRICLSHSYYYERLENKRYNEMSLEDVWDVTWRSMFRRGDDTHGENIYKDYDYQFITGHVPTILVNRDFAYNWDYNELRIYAYGNLIDIDGGAAMGYQMDLNNGLLFLRLDDMKVFTVAFHE